MKKLYTLPLLLLTVLFSQAQTEQPLPGGLIPLHRGDSFSIRTFAVHTAKRTTLRNILRIAGGAAAAYQTDRIITSRDKQLSARNNWVAPVGASVFVLSDKLAGLAGSKKHYLHYTLLNRDSLPIGGGVLTITDKTLRSKEGLLLKAQAPEDGFFRLDDDPNLFSVSVEPVLTNSSTSTTYLPGKVSGARLPSPIPIGKSIPEIYAPSLAHTSTTTLITPHAHTATPSIHAVHSPALMPPLPPHAVVPTNPITKASTPAAPAVPTGKDAQHPALPYLNKMEAIRNGNRYRPVNEKGGEEGENEEAEANEEKMEVEDEDDDEDDSDDGFDFPEDDGGGGDGGGSGDGGDGGDDGEAEDDGEEDEEDDDDEEEDDDDGDDDEGDDDDDMIPDTTPCNPSGVTADNLCDTFYGTFDSSALGVTGPINYSTSAPPGWTINSSTGLFVDPSGHTAVAYTPNPSVTEDANGNFTVTGQINTYISPAAIAAGSAVLQSVLGHEAIHVANLEQYTNMAVYDPAQFTANTEYAAYMYQGAVACANYSSAQSQDNALAAYTNIANTNWGGGKAANWSANLPVPSPVGQPCL
jgi:hypothetical protein